MRVGAWCLGWLGWAEGGGGVRVYRYGCMVRGPLLDAAEEQLRIAHSLWNACVAIHRPRDEERLKLANSATGEVAALVAERDEIDAQVAAVRERLQGARAVARRSVDARETRQALAELNQRRRCVAERLKAARAEGREAVAGDLEASRAAEAAEIKRARQEHCGRGLYWGTSNAVLQGFAVAVKREMQDRTPPGIARLRAERREPSHPKFHSWDGSGFWAVQIATAAAEAPLLWGDVLDGADPRLSIRLSDGGRDTFIGRRGHELTRKHLSMVRMQIRGARAKRPDGTWARFDPAWLELPVVVHRQPDPGDRVVGAQVVRERIGGGYRYGLCVTVDDAFPVPRSGPAVAIDLGWRRRPDNGRLRVAYWVGEDGREGEVLLPEWVPAAPHTHLRGVESLMRHADEVEARRDVRFNALQTDIAAWWRHRELPDWLREVRDGAPERRLEDGRVLRARRPMATWRSQERVAAVARRWRANRFPGDHEGFALMQGWAKADAPLRDTAAHSRDKAEALRKNAWRVLAHELATAYALIGAEDMRLSELAHEPAVEEGPKSEGKKLRSQLRLAAPGALRQAIALAAQRNGATYRLVGAQDTTRTHHRCGQVVTADFSAGIDVYCPHCQEWYDQDRNAALVLLDRLLAKGCSGGWGGEGPEARQEPRGRFQRARARRQENENAAD